MIKILIPEIKTKTNKPDIRGLWLNDNHKLFYDYLRQDVLSFDIDKASYKIRFYDYLDKIKTKYNQEALFYDYNGIGFIYYNRDKIEILKHRIIKHIKRQDLRHSIKEALRQYKGLTIYRDIQGYILEVYHN